MLILAVDGVLLDGVDLGTDDNVDGLLLVGGEVEAAVLVGLGGGGVCVLGGVVEGVAVGHVDLGGVALRHDLVGKVVVDVGGLLGEGAGLVDGVLATVGSVEGRIGGVFVDRHHVQVGIVALVEEDLVALAHNDNVPRVDGARGAHEHRQDAVRGKDGGLVLVGEVLDDGVRGRGDVVGGAVDGCQLALGALDGLLVVGPVIRVQEAVVGKILAVVRVQVQLAQTVKVNLLEQVPVGLDVDGSIAVASRLVVVAPSEATATASTSSIATATAIVSSTAASTRSGRAATATTTAAGLGAALATATGKDGTTAISCLGGVAGVGDDGEGGLVLGGRGVESNGVTGSVNLLV